ncbi:hypothetical protein ABPG75_007412 [Micractinium tetrahymenae]
MAGREVRLLASASLALPEPKGRKGRRQAVEPEARAGNPVWELGAAPTVARLDPSYLATHRPTALLALVPRAAVLFGAGALSGALAKTLTAPLDRVKILLQVKGGLQGGAIGAAASQGNLLKAFLAIGKEEGLGGYWKGNLPQVLRVVPYSAAQFYSYEVFKRWFADEEGHLSVRRRLAAGACAGMVATLLTHPLDTLRLRLAVDPNLRGVGGTVAVLLKEGRGAAFYRGLGASMLGIGPYMGLEMASFDLLPQTMPSFARGFAAALIATVSCYPLDTIRRHIQLQAGRSVAWHTAAATILREDGLGGMYRGFLPNALKNLPNKGVKLSVFDTAKKMLQTAEAAYDDECLKQGITPPVRPEWSRPAGRRGGGNGAAAKADGSGKASSAAAAGKPAARRAVATTAAV